MSDKEIAWSCATVAGVILIIVAGMVAYRAVEQQTLRACISAGKAPSECRTLIQ